MCGIFGSTSSEIYEELRKQNMRRGQWAESHSIIGPRNELLQINKRKTVGSDLGPRPDRKVFEIGHIQAPTSKDRGFNIHPAEHLSSADPSWLWHNGLLKPAVIDELRSRLQSDMWWDTGLLNQRLSSLGVNSAPRFLSLVEGSFACVWLIGNELFIFRNRLAPLFVSEDNRSFSSLKTELTPLKLPANTIWQFHITADGVSRMAVASFETYNCPYNLKE